MRKALQAGVTVQLILLVAAACAATASARPVSGPHETIDNQLTTTHVASPTGATFTGTYHAAGNRKADPPYMRKMVFYPTPGFRYDTAAAPRCTASDLELTIFGPSRCPKASELGSGESKSKFAGRFPSTLTMHFFNAPGGQILLAESPFVSTVARGRIRRDMSVEYASPTCFPAIQPAGCPVDDALQLGSTLTIPPHTRRVGGRRHSYMTTAPRCPATRHWTERVRFWWKDGSGETLSVKQPCQPRGG